MGVWERIRFWLWVRPRAVFFRLDVYIDCRTGNDEGLGTKRKPLKTLAELNRRMHGRLLHSDLRVHVVEVGEDDGLELNVTFAPGVRIVFDGCWLNAPSAPV
jgi:hypothetical protein